VVGLGDPYDIKLVDRTPSESKYKGKEGAIIVDHNDKYKYIIRKEGSVLRR